MPVDASEVARVGAIETTDRAERPEFRFTHWVAVRRTALALYLIAFLVWTTQYGISTQRELVILWVCGALRLRLDRPPPAPDPAARARLAADRRRARRLRPDPRRRRLARDRRPPPDDDRRRPLPLLRPDPDRVAAGAPLRARRRQLVGRGLLGDLHLLLHRPLRARRLPLGARSARLPPLQQAPGHARDRRPDHLHPVPGVAAVDGRADGPARGGPPQHLERLQLARRRHRRPLRARPEQRQPRRRRALAALRLHGAGRDVPLEPGPARAGDRCSPPIRWRWA